MLCPNCGEEVPELPFCENCGNALATKGAQIETLQTEELQVEEREVPESATDEVVELTSEVIDIEIAPEDSSSDAAGQPGVYQWNDVPEDDEAQQHAEKAPAAAFVLSIVGLVLGLLGFSLVTIVPGIACCIISLLLNAKYNKEGKNNPHKTPTLVMGIVGIIAAVLMAVFFALVGLSTMSAIDDYESNSSSASAQAEASKGSSSSAASEASTSDASSSASSSSAAQADTSSSSAASQDSDSSSSANAASKSASSSPAVSKSSAAASAESLDSRAFDAKGNPSLFAILGLDGEELQDSLEASGYMWIDSAHSWMSSTGALLEVQGQGGLLKQEEIARLDEGAEDSAVVFVSAAVGYDTPQEALEGLSKDVTIVDTFEGTDDDIVFALIREKRGEEHLAALSKTSDSQQTALVFTEKAIKEGLFTNITGVDAGTSIKEVWKALTSQG